MIDKILKIFLNRETVTYLIVGVLTTIVNIIAFKLACMAGIFYLISDVIAWVISVIFAFVTNKIFVFQSKSWKPSIVKKEAIGFTAARIVSLVFDMLFMFITVSVLHWNEDLAKIISNVFVVVMNYVFSKMIFKNKD